MLLAGDIGGTKTNLSVYLAEGGLTPSVQATFRSAKYPSLEAVVTEFLSRNHVKVERAVFGVAGPVIHGRSAATNLPWVISEESLQETLGINEVKLLNDLEATAYGVPHLAGEDLVTLNDAPARSGTKAVIAPGTGLGQAILLTRPEGYQVMPSEGGHTDFAPTNLFELELLRSLMGKFGHVSYESVCSGRGIPIIYAYLKENRFADELPAMAEALGQAADQTPIIVEKAVDFKLGARGLRSICEAVLSDAMFELPGKEGVEELRVTAEYARQRFDESDKGQLKVAS